MIFEDDWEAHKFLEARGFHITHDFVIRKPNREPLDDEWDAIDYLCGEGDYAYA